MCQQFRWGPAGIDGAAGLDILLAPVWTDVHRRTEARLQSILRSRFERVSEASVQDFSVSVLGLLNWAVAVRSALVL
jgi:hypothetical protein